MVTVAILGVVLTNAKPIYWTLLKSLNSRSYDEGYEAVVKFARSSAPAGAVFAVPIEDQDFSMLTGYSTAYNWKSAPHNEKLIDWIDRLHAVTGVSKGSIDLKEFANFSFLKDSYHSISPAQIRDLKTKYDVDYYVVNRPRNDLPFNLVLDAGNYSVFEID